MRSSPLPHAPLGGLVRIKSGGTPSKGNIEYWGDDLPWITAKDLKSRYLVGSIQKLSAAGRSIATIAPADALLILVRGMGLFKDMPISICKTEVAFNQDVKALIPGNAIDSGFLYCALESLKPVLMQLVEAAGHGTGRLDTAKLLALPIPLPPLQEQHWIAAILGTWDAAIEKAGRLLDAAQSQFEALRTELYREDGSEERLTFGAFLDESRVPGNNGSTARKLTVRLYGKGIGPKQDRTAGSANTRYYIRRAGQFIYSRLDFLNGAFAVVPDHLDGFESTLDLPAFEIAPRVNSIWLLNYVTRPAYYENQQNLARGQRVARRVNPDDLLASEIAVPTRERQDEVAAILTLCIDGINSIRSLVVALRRQKTGLMQKLLTGKIRVPEAVADLSPAAD